MFVSKKLFLLYVEFKALGCKPKYFIRLSQLPDELVKQKHIFFQPAVVYTPIPEITPKEKKDRWAAPYRQYTFPEVFIVEIEDACVHGATNLVTKDDLTIAHDLFDLNNDFTSEELHFRLLIKPKKNLAIWLTENKNPEYVDIAANFVDACASNYAHWLTEVLPRIALFCRESRFNDIPIVINDGLHKNILESLALITGTQRKIITLSVGQSLNVHRLFLVSSAGYVPFERRNKRSMDFAYGKFHPDAFQFMKQTIADKTSVTEFFEKIYLRRNSGIRKILNSNEVEKYLADCGFKIIEPEKLSFIEQASVFFNAKIIIGGSGAALANTIFCQPDTKIIIFMPDAPKTNFCYWQNLACATGNKINYIFTDAKKKREGIHSDYSVPLKDIADVLAS